MAADRGAFSDRSRPLNIHMIGATTAKLAWGSEAAGGGGASGLLAAEPWYVVQGSAASKGNSGFK
eukprot:1389631-Heterocapsa_arctica.AAC.1